MAQQSVETHHLDTIVRAHGPFLFLFVLFFFPCSLFLSHQSFLAFSTTPSWTFTADGWRRVRVTAPSRSLTWLAIRTRLLPSSRATKAPCGRCNGRTPSGRACWLAARTTAPSLCGRKPLKTPGPKPTATWRTSSQSTQSAGRLTTLAYFWRPPRRMVTLALSRFAPMLLPNRLKSFWRMRRVCVPCRGAPQRQWAGSGS